MGGPGSGRWGWHDKKATVEDCLTLSAGTLARDGAVARYADRREHQVHGAVAHVAKHVSQIGHRREKRLVRG